MSKYNLVSIGTPNEHTANYKHKHNEPDFWIYYSSNEKDRIIDYIRYLRNSVSHDDLQKFFAIDRTTDKVVQITDIINIWGV